MKTVKLRTLLIAATILGVVPAMAADLAYKAPMMAPVSAAPAINWNGFYFGGTVGYGWGNFTSTDDVGNSASMSANGGVYGAFAGVNYVWPGTNFLLGVEIDGLGTSERGSTPIVANNGRVIGTINGSEDFVATARLRGGFTWDRWLFYVTGGGAYGSGSSNNVFNDGTVSPTFHEPGVGWTIGAGFDYILPWFGANEVFTGVLYKYTSLTGLNDSLGGKDTFTDNEILWRLGYKFPATP
jgi:outer membrane immunogenic protein